MRRFIGIASALMLLSGCNYHADHPWDYTPYYSTQPWQPCGDEGIPISSPWLIDPHQCTSSEKLPDIVGLPEILDLSLQNSNATRETWADARYAAAIWGLSEFRLYPQWSAGAVVEAVNEAAFFGQGNPLIIDRYANYEPFIALNSLLFDWGTTLSQAESFRQTLWEANWTHNREIQTVIETVATDYYSFLTNKELVIAAEANLADAMVVLDSTQKKHHLGITDLSDVLMAETQVAKNEIQLLNDQQTEADSRVALIADMGIPANTPVTVAGNMDIPSLDAIDRSLDSYLAQSFVSRPDLFAANAQVKSKEASVEAAIRNQYPTLNLSSSFGKSYFNRGENKGYNYSVAINLDIPLFSGFAYRNQIRAARAQLEKAQATMRQLEIDMIQQVTQSHQDFWLAVDKVQVNEAYVRVAGQSYQSSLAKYRAGTVDITTVVNTQTDLADARYSLVSAKNDWFSSLIQLAYATGSMCS